MPARCAGTGGGGSGFDKCQEATIKSQCVAPFVPPDLCLYAGATALAAAHIRVQELPHCLPVFWLCECAGPAAVAAAYQAHPPAAGASPASGCPASAAPRYAARLCPWGWDASEGAGSGGGSLPRAWLGSWALQSMCPLGRVHQRESRAGLVGLEHCVTTGLPAAAEQQVVMSAASLCILKHIECLKGQAKRKANARRRRLPRRTHELGPSMHVVE